MSSVGVAKTVQCYDVTPAIPANNTDDGSRVVVTAAREATRPGGGLVRIFAGQAEVFCR